MSTEKIYDLVDRRTSEILAKFDALEKRVSTLERWKDRATTYVSIAVGIVTLAWSFAFDWVKKTLKLNV